jgi:YHS domain-containing protein
LLVICKGCRNKIDRETAYKVVVKGKNNYYCNVKEYETINTEKESKNKVIDLSFELIGQTTNTALFKELTEIANVHTYTKMLKFMEENYIDLDVAISSNSYVHEYAKIRYFAAIIKNQIGDFKEKVENTEVHDFDYVEEVKYTPTKKKSFTDFIDEY